MVEQIIIRVICATALAAGLIEGCTGCATLVETPVPARTDNLIGFMAYKHSLAPEFPADTLGACVCSAEEYAQADGQ